ncbi:MAG: XRE family transcriptional regulator [Lachnospiraceae bacterium]|nr:XRE family transcriptional regulator [Lachnospiraceae bacterium]
MVRNNIEVDVKVKCIESRTTQKQDGVVNHTFVRVMEALGYDIELHYVKREDS